MKSAIVLLLANNAKSSYLNQLDVEDASIYQDSRINEEIDYENLISDAEPSKPDKFEEVSQLTKIFSKSNWPAKEVQSTQSLVTVDNSGQVNEKEKVKGKQEENSHIKTLNLPYLKKSELSSKHQEDQNSQKSLGQKVVNVPNVKPEQSKDQQKLKETPLSEKANSSTSKTEKANVTANSTVASSSNVTSSSNKTLSSEALSSKVPELRWDHSPKEIEQITNDMIKESDQRINAVIQVNGTRTFENTITPLAHYEYWQSSVENNMGFYSSVSTVKEVRDASKEFDRRSKAYSTELWLREDLYKAINGYKEVAVKDGSFAKLDNESQRYVNKILEDMETGGLKLDERKRYDLLQLTKEIDALVSKAEENINSDKTKLAFSEADLKGLSPEIMKTLEPVKDKAGWRYVSIKPTQLGPVMKLVQNPDVRKALEFAAGSKNKDTNVEIIETLVEKRQVQANMLGYTSYSEMILEPRMAKNPITVQNFENDLIQRLQIAAFKEKDRIAQTKFKLTGNMTLNTWDTSFYGNIYKKDKYNVDEEVIKEYFPAEKVKQSTMDIYQELLSLDFVRVPNAQVWHPDVTCYEVRDKASKNTLGHFYMDLYPRDDKYGHAAAFPILKIANIDGQTKLAAAAMVTNFNPATADAPSLLPHREVVTFFHEFGHIMHNMCSESRYARFSGTSVETDFVEMPSQMLENWIWSKEILQKVSSHYKTGKPMPDELIMQKIESQKMGQATEILNQVSKGSIDLILSSASDEKLLNMLNKNETSQSPYSIAAMRREVTFRNSNLTAIAAQSFGQKNLKVDTEALWHRVTKQIEGIDLQKGTNPIASFGHLINGYVSQYYSYQWSKVYSCDIFQEFKQKGLLNPEVGMKYRKVILAPGGSRDSAESLKLFLGREPNQKAFLQMQGLE